MNIRSRAKRYAKVLFESDRSEGVSEQRVNDFNIVLSVLRENPRLMKFLEAPQVPLDERKAVLKKCFQTLDSRWTNFLDYLIGKGRVPLLYGISEEYRLLVHQHLQIQEAEIITAVPLDAQSEEKLKSKLERDYHKQIKLNKRVDPRILGGAILIFDNEMLDWSVAGRLRKLKDNLNAAQV